MSDLQEVFSLIFVEPDPEVSRLVASTFELELGVTVFEARSGETAIDFLETVSQTNLVVIGDPEKDAKLVGYLREQGATRTLYSVFCVDKHLKDPSLLLLPNVLGVITRKTLLADLTKIVKDKFFPGEILVAQNPNDFCRIRTELVLVTMPLVADIFIRLSEQKYLRLFRGGDQILAGDIEKYAKEKKVPYLFIKRCDSESFTAKLHEEVNRLIQCETTEAASLRAVAINVFDTVHGITSSVGVTAEVRELTKASVSLVIKQVGKSPQLSDVFQRIDDEMGQYIVRHSLALAQIACVFAAKVDMQSDTTFQKLSLAALFHDITIKNNELAKEESLQSAQKKSDLFVLETLEEFKNHPIKAAELVSQLPDVASDVNAIVRQHHEKLDGTGFPFGIGHQYVSPLSCVFIIAHDYLNFSREKGGQPPLDEFFTAYREKYHAGSFKQVVRKLEEALLLEQKTGAANPDSGQKK
ncbi:HD domain-containing phosphohydrolase [Bdellovibrionota bacterium FG-2]